MTCVLLGYQLLIYHQCSTCNNLWNDANCSMVIQYTTYESLYSLQQLTNFQAGLSEPLRMFRERLWSLPTHNKAGVGIRSLCDWLSSSKSMFLQSCGGMQLPCTLSCCITHYYKGHICQRCSNATPVISPAANTCLRVTSVVRAASIFQSIFISLSDLRWEFVVASSYTNADNMASRWNGIHAHTFPYLFCLLWLRPLMTLWLRLLLGYLYLSLGHIMLPFYTS